MSNTYWKRRAVQKMFENMESAEKEADAVAKFYASASVYYQKEIEKIFSKYKDKHGLTRKEAEMLLTRLKDKTSLDEALNILRNGDQSENKQQFIKYMEAPAYSHRISRFEALQAQTDAIMQNIYKLEKNHTDSFYSGFVEDVYYNAIYDLHRRTGVGFSFAHISKDDINRIINTRWYGQNYSSRIWNNTQALAQALKEELMINFLTGRTDREAAKAIEAKFAGGASQARRLIRTESAFLTEEMDMKAYTEAGISKYMFMATLDLKTSDICRRMDGKIFLVSQKEPGKTAPPMHPWCRSTTIAIINEKYLDRLKRRFRDPNNPNKFIEVPMTMKYEDWYNQYVKGTAAQDKDEVWKDVYTEEVTSYNGSIPKSWDKIEEVVNDDAVKNANPHYNSSDEGYRKNCANCAVAYEMRKRGYDVTAMPLSGHKKGSRTLKYRPYLAWEDITPIKTNGNGLGDIAKEMARWEDGSRAEITFSWNLPTKNGHVIVAEINGEEITFYDPQNGRIFPMKDFELVKNGSVEFWRISDATISQLGATACREKR